MKNRRAFLIASGAAGVAVALARASDRSATAGAAPAAVKPPSEAARAVAATMRRFDPALSASELDTIARGIDDATTAAAALRTKRKPLRNADEPVTRFVVPFA